MRRGNEPKIHAARTDNRAVAGRVIGHEVRSVTSTGSTMDDVAKLAASGTPEGLVLSAGEQTAGRGRHQRAWESAPGQDLLFSILFRPRPAIAGEINMLLALAIAELVDDRCGVETTIKWPNDVRVNEAKIAGILLESAQAEDLAVVAGIGLNVNSRMREIDLGSVPAISMRDITGNDFDRNELLKDLLNRVDGLYADVRAGGTVIPAWKDRLDTLGQYVNVTFVSVNGGEKRLSGIAEDVDVAGRLIVRDENGRAWPVSAGEVTLRSPVK